MAGDAPQDSDTNRSDESTEVDTAKSIASKPGRAGRRGRWALPALATLLILLAPYFQYVGSRARAKRPELEFAARVRLVEAPPLPQTEQPPVALQRERPTIDAKGQFPVPLLPGDPSIIQSMTERLRAPVFSPEQLRQREAQEKAARPGLWSTIGDLGRTSWIASDIFRTAESAFTFSEYSPNNFRLDQEAIERLSDGIPTEWIPEFANARNERDAQRIRGNLVRLSESWRRLAAVDWDHVSGTSLLAAAAVMVLWSLQWLPLFGRWLIARVYRPTIVGVVRHAKGILNEADNRERPPGSTTDTTNEQRH